MKGIVFTEFMEMVEDVFSPEVWDTIIEKSQVASGGAYTMVGTYDHHEMVKLVNALSMETGIAPDTLYRVFGKHLFARFVLLYPHYFAAMPNAFSILKAVQSYIHVEVRKLYPDSELPDVIVLGESEEQLKVLYQSERRFSAFAEGLIEGCVHHYQENIRIEKEALESETGEKVLFTLTHQRA